MLKKPKWHACGKNIICMLDFSWCRTAVRVLNRRTRVRILICATCQTEKLIRLTGRNNKFIPFQGQVHQIGRFILHYKLYSFHSDKIIIVLVASGLWTVKTEKVLPVMLCVCHLQISTTKRALISAESYTSLDNVRIWTHTQEIIEILKSSAELFKAGLR